MTEANQSQLTTDGEEILTGRALFGNAEKHISLRTGFDANGELVITVTGIAALHIDPVSLNCVRVRIR